MPPAARPPALPQSEVHLNSELHETGPAGGVRLQEQRIDLATRGVETSGGVEAGELGVIGDIERLGAEIEGAALAEKVEAAGEPDVPVIDSRARENPRTGVAPAGLLDRASRAGCTRAGELFAAEPVHLGALAWGAGKVLAVDRAESGAVRLTGRELSGRIDHPVLGGNPEEPILRQPCFRHAPVRRHGEDVVAAVGQASVIPCARIEERRYGGGVASGAPERLAPGVGGAELQTTL